MNEKFKANIRIVLPFAFLTTLIYILMGLQTTGSYEPVPIEWLKVLPYLVVLITALAGVNVMLVLCVGILFSGAVGLWCDGFDVWGWTAAMGTGINQMGELIIVTLLAGGMLEMIRFNGGIDWIIAKLTAHIQSRRGAEGSIAALVSFANLCTANNTIAIITVGQIARRIAQQFGLSPRNVASLLDTCSCIVQCIIPYGAQSLLAAGIAGVTPVAFITHLYYPWALALMVALSIIFHFPRYPKADVQ